MDGELSNNGHYLAGKKIIIVDAGFFGLAFTVALRQKWDKNWESPQIVIYDRDDPHPPLSRLGYTLSLRGFDINGGLVCCASLGPPERRSKQGSHQRSGIQFSPMVE